MFSLYSCCSLLLLWISCTNADPCSCANKIVMLFDKEDYRVLSSPDYPRYYCPNLDCLWRIVAPTNASKVHFFADNLDLRYGKDFIQFYDKRFLMDTGNESANHQCTGDDVCKFESTGQYLSIRFITAGGETDHFGFQGTVSPFDRQRRAAKSAITRYALLIGFCLLLLLGLTGAFAILRKKVTRGQNNANYILADPLEQDEKLLLTNVANSGL